MTRPSDRQKQTKKKRTCRIVNLAVPADYSVKKEKKDEYLNLAGELIKNMEREVDGDTNCNWSARYSHQKIGTETGGLGNTRISGDHPD